MWAWGPVTNPTARALARLLCALGGSTRAPGGGRLLSGCVASLAGRAPTSDRLSLGGASGARYPLAVGAGGVGLGTHHQPHSARSCELALRVAGAARGRPEGRRLLPGCGLSRVGRSPTPNRPSFRRAARARYPLAAGAGDVGVGTLHQPHSARSCELALRVVGAAQGRPGGGVACLGVRRPVLGAHPRLTACPSGVRPGLPTYWFRVRRGRLGTRHQPHSVRSCVLALRPAGAPRGRPGGGGGSCLDEGRPWLGALSRRTAPASCVRLGPATHWLWVRCAGLETRHQPHSARSCVLALRPAGAARGRPGGRLLPGCGASVVWPSSTPDCSAFVPAAGARYALAVGAPCELAFRAARAPSGGGRLLPGWGRPWLGTLRRPTARPSGVRPGPLPTGSGCGLRAWRPSQTPQRALLRAGFGCCGGGARAPRGGGGVTCLGVGRPWLGALPRPTACPSGMRPGPATHRLLVRCVGVGTRQQPHSVRSCELALQAAGAAQRRPGGGSLLPG